MAINGGNLARNTLFPTIMITRRTLTAQGDLSTGAENIIWDTNQTLLEEGFADLHIAFLKCFLTFANMARILKKDVFYSIKTWLILIPKLVNITDSTVTKSMRIKLPPPASSTDRDTPPRNIDLNLIQEEKRTAILFPVFSSDNTVI